MKSAGILASDTVVETSGAKLAADGPEKVEQMLSFMCSPNYHECAGGVLFVDEAYQLTAPHTAAAGRQVLDIILTAMENNIGKLLVIFAGYKEDMQTILEHNPGLASRIPFSLSFEDFSDAELWKILDDNIEKKYSRAMQVEDGMRGLYMHIAIRRLGRGRGSKSFGNSRTVENLLGKIAERQAIRLRKEAKKVNNPNHFFFTKQDLIGCDPSKAKFQSRAWGRLQKLIGLESVKASVENMIGMIELNYHRELAEREPLRFSLNQVFVGSSETGKTTACKLYGQIMADLGLLSRGEG